MNNIAFKQLLLTPARKRAEFKDSFDSLDPAKLTMQIYPKLWSDMTERRKIKIHLVAEDYLKNTPAGYRYQVTARLKHYDGTVTELSTRYSVEHENFQNPAHLIAPIECFHHDVIELVIIAPPSQRKWSVWKLGWCYGPRLKITCLPAHSTDQYTHHFLQP